MNFDGDSFTHSTREDGYDFSYTDKWSKKRHFKISSFPVPSGLLSEAVEVVPDNEKSEPYTFSILSPFDSDIEKAEDLLKAKIKRGVNKRYLKKREGGLGIDDDNELQGRIEWDDQSKDTHYENFFVIDGKRITIEEFAEILKSWEGWQFSFKIFDRTEEIERQ